MVLYILLRPGNKRIVNSQKPGWHLVYNYKNHTCSKKKERKKNTIKSVFKGEQGLNHEQTKGKKGLCHELWSNSSSRVCRGCVWNIKGIIVPFLYADHPAAVRYSHWTSAHDSGCLVDETAHGWQLTWRTTIDKIVLKQGGHLIYSIHKQTCTFAAWWSTTNLCYILFKYIYYIT